MSEYFWQYSVSNESCTSPVLTHCIFFLQSASLLDSNKCVYVCVCRGSGGEPVVDAEVANFPVCVPDMHTNLHS